jgi:hypothetical protein
VIDWYCSLCQALDLMLDGVQQLVVPINRRRKQGKPLKIPGPLTATGLPSGDYSWISQEDVVRYLLTSLGAFYPLPMMSLEELSMINTDIMMVDADSPGSCAVPLIERASQEMTAVAVVTGLGDGVSRPKLAGDISMQTLRGCNESAAAALSTLSVKEFLQYIRDVAGPSKELVEKVANKMKLKVMSKLGPSTGDSPSNTEEDVKPFAVKLLPTSSDSSIEDDSELSDGMSDFSESDEDHAGTSPSILAAPVMNLKLTQPKVPQETRAKILITCRPHSSLVAVMAQALAHRVNHVWVTDVEGGIVGIVTYADMIGVLLSHLHFSN